MRYRVEFKNNIPVKAIQVSSVNRADNLTDFGEEDGRRCIRHLYVEAENETDALQQAQRIATTIFRF